MGYKIYAPKPIYDEGMQALKDMGFEFIGVGKGDRKSVV